MTRALALLAVLTLVPAGVRTVRASVAAPGALSPASPVELRGERSLVVPPAEGAAMLGAPVRAGHRYRVVAGELREAPISGPRALALGLRLSVNRATADDLEALPGVGPRLAAALVQARVEGGPFTGESDLQRARGIGPVRAAALVPLVTFEP